MSSGMRIVHLCPYPLSRPGGVQRHVRDLCRWLEGQGHATRIVCPPGPGAPEPGVLTAGRTRDVTLHGTGFEMTWLGPRSRARVQRALRDWGAEVVHLHTPWTPMLPWQVWRGLGLPTVATLHATLPEARGTGLLDRYIRAAVRHFDRRVQALVLPSDAPRAQYAELGLRHVPLVLPPAIDLSDWAAARVGAKGTGPLRVVSLGRFEARKGIGTVLAAWPAVRAALPGARLVLAGRGTPPAPLPEGVDLVADPDDAAARALVAAADLLVAPAGHGESFGLVLVEAMAAGTLPVAAANPGYASVLTGPGAALLVPPGDPPALARRIVALAADPALRAQLTDWVVEHAQRFDVRAVGPEYVALYRRIRSGG